MKLTELLENKSKIHYIFTGFQSSQGRCSTTPRFTCQIRKRKNFSKWNQRSAQKRTSKSWKILGQIHKKCLLPMQTYVYLNIVRILISRKKIIIIIYIIFSEPGHVLNDCPQLDLKQNKSKMMGKCFKCGMYKTYILNWFHDFFLIFCFH